jgi:hypothetical protein
MLQLDKVHCAFNDCEPLLAQQDQLGRTPLYVCAAQRGCIEEVYLTLELLLHDEANLLKAASKQDSAGRTVLHAL